MTQVRQREAQRIFEAAVARYQMYPEYRDSRVEWLGEIPAHWEVRRLKTIVSLRPSNIDKKTNEDDVPVRLCNYTDVYYSDFITGDMELMEATATPDQIQKFELKAGDVIITKDSESADDIAVAAFVPHDLEKVVCGYHLALLRPLTGAVEGRYLFRAFSAYPITSQFEIAANGITRYGLSQAAIGDAWFLLPPPGEQRAIAAFLDRQTAKIDALIAKKRELIATLHEQRSAIISHAVTKGLNPDAPMKDSGIEWLGEIPAGWDAPRVKMVARLESGHTPSRNVPEYWDNCTIPWVSLADVGKLRSGKTDYIFETEEKISELGLANSAARLLPARTVILSRTASVGFSAILGVPMATTQDFVNWICGGNLIPEFLLQCFRAMKQEFESLTMGSTHQTIYMPDVARFRIPLPPLEEQRAIIDHINREIRQIDVLIAKTEETIERLQEYRAALISAAVTGKIDVRGEVSVL